MTSTTKGEMHISVPDPMAYFSKRATKKRTLTLGDRTYKVIRLSTKPGKIVIRMIPEPRA